MVIDKSNMRQVLTDFPQQCREGMGLAKGVTVKGQFNNILVCGMGGSAIAGDLLKMYVTDKPVYVVKDYRIPDFVDQHTLVFAVSYSGNTEETLSTLVEAKNRGAKVVGITTGGQLADLADTLIKVPAGLQPRNAVGYLFFPIIGILYNSGIIEVKNNDLNEMLKVVGDINYFDEKGKELAMKIKDKTAIIYSSATLGACAYRFKCEINENAKSPAFFHVFPEMCHNEIVGFEGMERSKFVILLVRNRSDHERIKKRMEVCKDLFEERVDVEEMTSLGDSLLAKMFSIIYLGDWTSYHLAMWKRIDPTPVHVIENLKRALG
ncbi:bifunctional phosphoglucose/phosphomannose isomerase [Candidatus Woesearchaeota archaeon]|nr:bifunctional phosphoglucose/phosphomannose isomerase [Candidatus Woesearchaeota archaeon]